MPIAIRVKCYADGKPTPHDGRLVATWTPHVKAGALEVTSTMDEAEALRYDTAEDAAIAWNTVSKVQPFRPWDRRPNKPLTALHVELVELDS